MSKQMSLWDMSKFTCSPGLAVGQKPSRSPDGQARSGPGVALVRRSRALEKRSRVLSAKAAMLSRILSRPEFSSAVILNADTNGTQTVAISGQQCEASSRSAALQSSLENRLRERMASYGSPEYELRWKHWDMPLGGPICALRASARRTSDSDFTGWPTPCAGDMNHTDNHDKNLPLNGASMLAGWPTPNTPSGGRSVSTETMDATGRTADGKKHTASLEHAVKFAGWPTPRTPTGGAESRERKHELGRTESGGGDLQAAARLAGWSTPTANDATGSQYTYAAGNHDRPTLKLPGQASLVFGPIPSGSPAQTGKRGVLNPRFSLWLMGYPAAWASCGEQAMQSCRKLRRSS
jgi:hypothetical protein